MNNSIHVEIEIILNVVRVRSTGDKDNISEIVDQITEVVKEQQDD